MEKLGTIIPMDDDTRRLYSTYDFEYFLDRHIQAANYNQKDIDTIHRSYQSEKDVVKRDLKKNRKQALHFYDGHIRKCHSGGLLPSFFNLDETRAYDLTDFDGMGKTRAYFEAWSRAERRKIRWKSFWDVTIKIGAILGFVATAAQIISAFKQTP